MRFFFHLLGRHLRQYPGRALTALFVLTVASTLMLALAGTGAALRFRLGGYLDELFPEEQLWLESARSSLGPVAFESKPITEETVEQLSRLPGVEQVWPIEPLRFPVSVSGNLFGQELVSEAVIYGVPRELVADALKPDQPWGKATPTSPYPIIVSRYFLDLYNLGLARSQNLPLMSTGFVIGRHVTILLGRSAILGTAAAKPAREVRARVAGITSQPAMIGLAMPVELVREFNQEFATNPAPQYVSLVVRLKKGADRQAALAAVGKMGLTLSGGGTTGERLKMGVNVAGWGLIALAGAVFGLGMLTFYMLFTMIFHARRLDLIRLRALGVSPAGAVALALGEVGSIALLAVGLATAINAVLSYKLATLMGTLPELRAWLPEDLFEPSPAWLAIASAVILVATLLPALPTLRWVVKVEPGQVIRDL